MSEYGKGIGASGKGNENVGTTDKKTGRRWVRYVLWSVAIIAAALLVSGTIAALVWCN